MGVTLCLLFLLWFASGIVMMYWDYPGVTAADRLQHLPALDASRIRLSLPEAYERLELKRPANQAFLTTFDGRPAYRFRIGRELKLVFADDGAVSQEYPPELALRVAAQWSGQPPSAARMAVLTEEDQWTVSGAFRALRPLYKFTWPNADEVYVSQQTGQVVQPLQASRLGAYFGAFLTGCTSPLRKTTALARVVIWTSGLATSAPLSVDRRRVDVFAVAALPPGVLLRAFLPGPALAHHPGLVFGFSRARSLAECSHGSFFQWVARLVQTALQRFKLRCAAMSSAGRILEHPPARPACQIASGVREIEFVSFGGAIFI
jgi:hypothetical protein